ncbi:MAG TPA: hypothetical protein VIG24_04920 [Acidimicrobiia bacterium]
MPEHPCYLGIYVDHLYADCPSVVKQRGRTRCGCNYHPENVARVGDRSLGTVDPEGSDICSLCYRRWKRKQ